MSNRDQQESLQSPTSGAADDVVINATAIISQNEESLQSGAAGQDSSWLEKVSAHES